MSRVEVPQVNGLLPNSSIASHARSSPGGNDTDEHLDCGEDKDACMVGAQSRGQGWLPIYRAVETMLPVPARALERFPIKSRWRIA
jgi:hypothetical protein